MNGAAAVAADRDERSMWISSGPDQVFAVLHVPGDGAPAPSWILLCPPFGWEEECAHRGLVNWARALADAGHPTLRLDFPGTRNSTGGPPARRLERWTASVAAAATWLRTHGRAPRVTMLGIGLGGVVAYEAMLDGASIDDLILWSVPAAGRMAIRELRMHARVIAARFPDDNAPTPPDAPMEAIGFALERDALAEFEQIRLTERPLPAVQGRRALLLGRDDLTFDPTLEAHLRAEGVAVTSMAGWGHATLTDHPQTSRAPAETIAATLEWLDAGSGAPGPAAVAPTAGAGATASVNPVSTIVDLGAPEEAAIEFDDGDSRIRETAVRLPGRDRDLFAIITEPARPAGADAVCAVLLNSGSLSHVGPNRAWVEAARRWAGLGVSTVRVDFPGIGETDGDGDRLLDNVIFYDESWVQDTIAVLDGLQERGVASRFAICGLCSGAYWALHAALRDDRVVGALLLNLWAFSFSRELVEEREPGDALARLRHQGLGRLMRRDVPIEKLVKAIRSIAPGRVLAGARRDVEHAQVPEIVGALDHLRDHRTETLLLFASGEPTLAQLEREGLAADLHRWPQVSVERIPSRDHMFRTLALQRGVHAQLDAAMQRIKDRAGTVVAR